MKCLHSNDLRSEKRACLDFGQQCPDARQGWGCLEIAQATRFAFPNCPARNAGQKRPQAGRLAYLPRRSIERSATGIGPRSAADLTGEVVGNCFADLLAQRGLDASPGGDGVGLEDEHATVFGRQQVDAHQRASDRRCDPAG